MTQSGGFYDLANATMTFVASVNTRKTYAKVYSLWIDWCCEKDHNPMNLYPEDIYKFVIDREVVRSTMITYKSAMNKLLDTLGIYDNASSIMADRLRKMKIPYDVGSEFQRDKNFLKKNQVYKFISVWEDNDDPMYVRNYAIVTTLLYTGLRISELTKLLWRHVDLDDCIISVIGGKGNKDRDVPLIGGSDCPAVIALEKWREYVLGYEVVFPQIRKGGNIQNDSFMTPNGMHNIVKRTSNISGIPFASHDARRTFIESLDEAGTETSVIQKVVGHSDVRTTQKYMKKKTASELAAKMKSTY